MNHSCGPISTSFSWLPVRETLPFKLFSFTEKCNLYVLRVANQGNIILLTSISVFCNYGTTGEHHRIGS